MASHPFLLLLLHLLVLVGSAAAQPFPPSSSDDNYDRLTTTDFSSSTAAIIVILISAFFFLVIFSVYAHQCTLPLPSSSSSASRRVFAEAAAALRSRRRGLDPAILETFPTMLYSDVKGLRTDKTPLECAVCLSEFADDETLRMLPPCNHTFHPDCIDAWLASHTTCPVCRSNLAAADGPQAEPNATSENHVTIDIEEGGERDEQEVEEEHALAPAARFPRSHTTGHDRYTLRLPERVMKEIVAAGRLRRAASCVAFPVGGEASGRRGYRGERSLRGSRSSRSHRWTRALSMRMTAWASVRRREVAEGSVSGVFPAVVKGQSGGGGWPENGGGENKSSTAPLAMV